MSNALMVDFGSTYTKIVVVNLETEQVIWTGQAPTTVENIMNGLNEALNQLRHDVGPMDFKYKLACSSAAGGLRMVAVGFVKELTVEAARSSALGAGAKVLDVFSYGLDDLDMEKIISIKPDIILLAGGTDGGDKNILIQNVELIARSPLEIPIILAGNRKAAKKAGEILRNGGKDIIITENVMPDLNVLNVEPARKAIREVFMRRIVSAKGLDKAQSFIGRILMPTPMAVLNAAELLAEGTNEEEGIGDLIIVDVGGATTDIHSIAQGNPAGNAFLKGLPEPYSKRTVEGDLGIRYNAPNILEMCGEEQILNNAGLSKNLSKDLLDYIELISSVIDKVPSNELEVKFDLGLARTAVEIAIRRHAGTIEEVYFPDGLIYIQIGKDLTNLKTVIATGGIFIHSAHGFEVLQGITFNLKDPFSLRPKSPEFYIDEKYSLFAFGLLAEASPNAALRLAKKDLKKFIST